MAEDEDLVEQDDWTPARGLIRGLVAGVVAAVILGAAADLLAWHAPLVALNGWLRTGASLFTMWLLFMVVHRAAGMAGPLCTALVVVLVLAIAYSQHVVMAMHGVPLQRGFTAGWVWCSSGVLVAANLWTAIGIVFGVLLWRDGASLGSLTDIVRFRVWGSSK